MAGLWNQEGIPHKGWQIEDVIDIREDGQSEWETDYENCMMCGHHHIRYVHILSHPEVDEGFRVGCVCAEKMTNDYVNPKQREKELRNKANRRRTWKKKTWKISRNGNYSLHHQKHDILIFTDKKSSKFKVKIDKTFGHKTFETLSKAKMAAFDGIEYYRKRGEW